MNETIAKAGMYGGSGTAVFGWLTVNEWCGVVGVLIAIIGFAWSRIDAGRRNRREEAEHALRMVVLRKEAGHATQED